MLPTKRNILLLLLLIGLTSFFCVGSLAQDNSSKSEYDRIADEYFTSDMNTRQKRKYLDSLAVEYTKRGDNCTLVRINNLRAVVMDDLNLLDSAMSYAVLSQSNFKGSCDSVLLAETFNTISALNISLSEFTKAIELANKGINMWKADWSANSTNRRIYFNLFTNRAIAFASFGDLTSAGLDFTAVLNEAIKQKDSLYISKSLINTGMIELYNGDPASALKSWELSREIATKTNNSAQVIEACLNISGYYQDSQLYFKAIQYLNIAYEEAVKKNAGSLRFIEKSYSNLYRKIGDYENAYNHFFKYSVISDSLFNLDKINAVADVQEKYESVKKGKEIEELKVKNLDSALQNERIKRTRNAMYAGAVILFLTLVFLYARFRIVRLNRNKLRSKNEIIERERLRSDGLLKNILPDEVAEELKEFGKAKARDFEKATILFTDFKGFTSLAEKLTASELVAELDTCFRAFDEITTRYNLEKIKTIGDAYMAVGGIPDESHHSPVNVILAALEMQQFMIRRMQDLSIKNWQTFRMRAGIHTGPVVAGVVGDKKFQYDVWGDSVNTASRMESSGEIDKVNISQTTYELIKNEPRLKFESRGLVTAKGKGEINMYFVELL